MQAQHLIQVPGILDGSFGSIAPIGQIFTHRPQCSHSTIAVVGLALRNFAGVLSVLSGVCTGICVISNAMLCKAAFPEANIVIDAALCACVTPESHDTALNAMRLCQMEILHQGEELWRK